MKAVKINCLIVSIHAHTGATKAGKFPLKNTSVRKPGEFRLAGGPIRDDRWNEMPQWRPVKIRAAISNAFGVAGGDHESAQRHGCRQYGRLKTILCASNPSCNRFAIAGLGAEGSAQILHQQVLQQPVD